MTLTLDIKPFAAAVGRAARAVGGSKINAILGHLRLETRDGLLEIVGTDLGERIATTVAAAGTLGPMLVDAARLEAILTRVKERGEVNLAADGDTLTIRAGRARFVLPVLDAKGFPDISMASVETRFKVEGSAFAKLLNALGPFCETSGGRPYLEGIAIERGKINDASATDCLVAVSTNGHVLYGRHIPVEGLDRELSRTTIPARSAATIAKLIDGAGLIEVRLSETKIGIEIAGLSYVSTLVEGSFPDWRRIFVKRAPEYAFDTAAAIEAVRTAMAGIGAASIKRPAIKLKFGDGETEFSARADTSKDAATASDVAAHHLIGDPGTAETAMAADYLIGAMSHIDAETVELSAGADGRDPIVLTGATLDDRRIVIMPMRA